MAFLFVQPIRIDEKIDEKTGQLTTLRLNVSELAPRNFNINLINQPAHVRNQLQKYVEAGQPLMMPIREGVTSSGIAFFSLEEGQIIPVSLEYARSVQNVHPDIPVVDLPKKETSNVLTSQLETKPIDKKSMSFG